MSVHRIAAFSLLLLGAVAACSNSDSEPQLQPRVNVVSQLPSSTPTATIVRPTVTSTPTPTSLPLPTLPPTPRSVIVSRLNDTVDPTTNSLLERGQPAPPVRLTDIDGNRYQLDRLEGRVVIINFWTLGCGSCFYEFPLLQAVRDEIAEEDLLILAVNVSELAEETRLLAQSLKATYPMIVDPQGAIFSTLFGGAVVPTTYFIAPDGTVFDVVIGPLDAYLMADHLQQLGIAIETES